MQITVFLQDVVDEMSMQTDDMTAYINCKTGELYTLTADVKTLIDDEDDRTLLPEWQQEEVIKADEILTSDDWLPLPTKYDIHEYSIMEDFCFSADNLEVREELLAAIKGRGAFRYFKSVIHRYGIQDEWYQYRDNEIGKKAISWLKNHGILYKPGRQSAHDE